MTKFASRATPAEFCVSFKRLRQKFGIHSGLIREVKKIIECFSFWLLNILNIFEDYYNTDNYIIIPIKTIHFKTTCPNFTFC